MTTVVFRQSPTPLFVQAMELYTGLHLSRGNAAQQMLNGVGTYPQLWKDLRAAKQTITVQNYYSQPGEVADTMAAVLKERARAGVRVLFVLDAFGSQNLKEEWADSLRAANVEVALLRQLHWYSLHNASDRSHVRAVVIDGEIGYTGGFGLADYWLGDGRSEGSVARDERSLRGAGGDGTAGGIRRSVGGVHR